MGEHVFLPDFDDALSHSAHSDLENLDTNFNTEFNIC